MTNDNRIPPNQQLAKGDRWPVVGERSPRGGSDPWRLQIAGEISRPFVFDLEEIAAMPHVTRSVDVHCVTRWSKLSMEFRGVPLLRFLSGVESEPLWSDSAKYVSFVARSERAHSTSLPLEDVLRLDPLVALTCDGQPLSQEHGGPIRLVVPGRYFYKSVKWLERIELLSRDHLGYWESEAGYHNEADPWKEQRYIAATIDRREAARLIAARDFSNRNLLSLQVSGLDLEGLNADAAMLRNADFSDASLRRASFEKSNLSNARLRKADLRFASFRGADLEGADFAGADLRGADLRGTSLFGATLCDLDSAGDCREPAVVDAQTRIDGPAIESLDIEQRSVIATLSDP